MLYNAEYSEVYTTDNLVLVGNLNAGGATMEETRNECRIFVGKPLGKRPTGRLRRTWISNIKDGPS
jgi:hypothetical protein